jgi:hypothetical protein
MRHGVRRASLTERGGRRPLLALACSLVLAGAAAASPAAQPAGAEAPTPVLGGATVTSAAQGGPSVPGSPSVTLEQCVAASQQAERSATFSSEMTATPGTGRMSIRIELLERLPGEAVFHMVAAPGLGSWRAAAPGVKVYRYIKQVTNLSAPATYRAAVRFHWLNAKGKLIRATERRTAACVQHATPPPPAPGAPPA